MNPWPLLRRLFGQSAKSPSVVPSPKIDPSPDPHAEAIRRIKQRQGEQERRLRAIESSRDVLRRRYPH